MSRIDVTPKEAADRLSIRELVEAYAHCADRRDAKGQMSLFTTDTHFVVYMNAKDPQVRRHHALRWTEHNLHTDRRSSHGGSVLPGASRHGRRWQATLDDRVAPLP
jgi:SnoaL-like domain